MICMAVTAKSAMRISNENYDKGHKLGGLKMGKIFFCIKETPWLFYICAIFVSAVTAIILVMLFLLWLGMIKELMGNRGVCMGDGKKLKECLDRKGISVRRVSKESGISATTLYSIIQRDSDIRLDFAFRLANVLGIDVNAICSTSPFSGEINEETYSSVYSMLTAFYQLDDEGRKEIVEMIQSKLQYHNDAEKAEHIKQITDHAL